MGCPASSLATRTRGLGAVSDDLLPALGPIAAARAAIEVAIGALSGDAAPLRRLDGADRDVVALVGALAQLCSLLAQAAAFGVPGADAQTPADLLAIVGVHQQARHDLDSL